MNLPYNLTPLPGVKQKANGKLYKLAAYPSGKLVEIPYEESPEAQPARMLPVSHEPVFPLRDRGPTTGLDTKRKVVFRPKRMAVLEFRRASESSREKLEVEGNKAEEYLRRELLPLCRWTGKEWIPIESFQTDWHVMYHYDSKEAANDRSGSD